MYFILGRGRENRENDRTGSDFNKENWRSTGTANRGNRGGRGGYGSRGGRGGRTGPRGATNSRDFNRDRNQNSQNDLPPEVDSWDANQITPDISTFFFKLRYRIFSILFIFKKLYFHSFSL